MAAVIRPSETSKKFIDVLEMLENKRDKNTQEAPEYPAVTQPSGVSHQPSARG